MKFAINLYCGRGVSRFVCVVADDREGALAIIASHCPEDQRAKLWAQAWEGPDA